MTAIAVANIKITPGDTRPIFRQIVDGLRLQIASGDLPIGSKLPSVRGLAQQLTINPNTVAKAYNELTSQGLLEARSGLGVFVAKPKQKYSQEEQQTQLNNAVQSFVNEVAYLDFDKQALIDAVDTALDLLHKKNNAGNNNG